MNELLKDVLSRFQLDTPAVSCEPYGCGHVNVTYVVVTESKRRYILQKISTRAFKDVPALMANISAVTSYLRERTDDPRGTLTLIPTVDGECFLDCGNNDYYRVYDFIEDSLCLQAAETPEDFYQSAVGFGRFQQMLKDFPAETLSETIVNFHNTKDRYRIFRETLAADPCGRAAGVQAEIEFALARAEEASILVDQQAAGLLPTRVTHNDTKLNNVMLDAETKKALCVIDLDTVMPGLSLYDFGDSIRFGASTAAEDEKDLSKVEMNLELFRIYARGFLQECPGLTEQERKMMPMGAKMMTLECGVRFLTDYLDGDNYFKTHYDGHNLDRCRTQFKLVADMEQKWADMERIIKEETK